MSTTAIKRYLRDNNNDIILPYSVASGIIMNDGVTNVDDRIEYLDNQVSSLTVSGMPKLVSYEYDVYGTADNQKVYQIPYDYFDTATDTLQVSINGTDVPKSYYVVTMPVTNAGVITKGYITLNTGRPNGTYVKIRILKNVPIGSEGSINGNVMATGTIPQDRIVNVSDFAKQTDIDKTMTRKSNQLINTGDLIQLLPTLKLDKLYTVTSTVTNIPSAEWFNMVFIGQDANSITAELTGLWSHKKWYLNLNNGGNSGWKQILVPTDVSNPNLLINGDFQVWQRGTSFLNVSTYGQYSADRWRIDVNNGSNASVEKSGNDLKFTMNTNGSFCPLIVQDMEIPKSIRGKKVTFTVNFGTVSGKFAIRLQNYTGGVHTGNNTTLLATTNGSLSISMDVPDNVERLYAIIASIGDTTAGSYCIIKNAKLELGSISTLFFPKPYVEELSDCMRFYEKSFDGTISSLGALMSIATATNVLQGFQFKVTKRVPPSVIVYSPSGTANRVWINGTDANNATNIGVQNIGVSGVRYMNDGSFTIGNGCTFHYVADAEIY